jgi:predicted transcriptional regulator
MLKGLWGGRWRRGTRDPLGSALGSLERQVMELIWNGAPYTVRDVQARLPKIVAYTTAMTTLDRLFKKGFVQRTRSGRAFVYIAAQTREQFETAMASGMLTGLIAQRTTAVMPILSNLVDSVGSEDGGLDLLNALEEMVRDKRRRLERGNEGRDDQARGGEK